MDNVRYIKYDNGKFLMIFTNGKWWYVTKQVADYLEYSLSNPERSAEIASKLVTNQNHKMVLKKKGNEEIFATHLPSVVQISSKTNQIQLLDEDGLIILAINSDKPNAKLLVEDMIKVFKVELDKAGINAMEYLLRIEKDNNILINSRISEYMKKGTIKYNHSIINQAINELVFYKYFPECNFSKDINTDKLREVYSNDTHLKDRDASNDRYNIGNSLLEILNAYYMFNKETMSLKEAKYIYVSNNNYDERVVELFKNRLD